jgi:hypothetical protein
MMKCLAQVWALCSLRLEPGPWNAYLKQQDLIVTLVAHR